MAPSNCGDELARDLWYSKRLRGWFECGFEFKFLLINERSLDENLNENMASGGGDGDEENPFSFKKFIKKTSKERTNSDSDWEDGSEDEEPALDLLDTSNHSKGNSF